MPLDLPDLPDLTDVPAFVAVVRQAGFREAARVTGISASALSLAVRRLESRLGVRLLNRSTRSIAPTEAGQRLLDRLLPSLGDIAGALATARSSGDRPAGTLRLNAPGAARIVLAPLLPAFLAAHPDIEIDLIIDESFVDILAAGCDAGIRYEERLDADMIAVPIGPRTQRMATAASPAYLDANGRPLHPRDLDGHACLRGRFASGHAPPWEFERDGERVRIEPTGPLTVRLGGGVEIAIDAALAGVGVVHVFEDWLRPHFERGALEPILRPWWQDFSGPFLYYPGRRLVPAPLRAFIDFLRAGLRTQPRR